MKKFDYQAPKMVAVKLNRKPTLLVGSGEEADGCLTKCTEDGD